MKVNRRTLLASLVAVVAPVRALVSKPLDSPKDQGPENKMTPYDAVKTVYGGFDPVEGFEEFVFQAPTNLPQNYAQFFCKKIVSLTGKHKGELWVVLVEEFFNSTCMKYSSSKRFVKLVRPTLYLQEAPFGEKLQTILQYPGAVVISASTNIDHHNVYESVGIKQIRFHSENDAFAEKGDMNSQVQKAEFQIFSQFIQLIS